MERAQSVILTERFTLRPVEGRDQALIELHLSDERVARATRWIPHPLPPGTVEALLERAHSRDRAEDVWVLDGSASGQQQVTGLVSLSRMDREQSEISFWVVPSAWGSGYASEAVQALVAGNPKRNRTIFAEVFQDNPASARVLTNTGFRWLGDAETFCIARNALVPTWTYSLKLD